MKVLIASFNTPSYDISYLNSLVPYLGRVVDVIVPVTPNVNLTNTYVVSTFTVFFKDNYNLVKIRKSHSSSSSSYFISSPLFLNTDLSIQTLFQKILFFSLCVREFVLNSLNSYDLVHSFGIETGLIGTLLKAKLEIDCPALIFSFNTPLASLKVPANLAKWSSVLPINDSIMSFDEADNDIDLLLEGVGHSDFIITNNKSMLRNNEVLAKLSLDLSEVLSSRYDRILGITPGPSVDFYNFDVINKIKYRNLVLKNLFKIENSSNKPIFLYNLSTLTVGLNSRSFIYKIINESKNISAHHIFLVDSSFVSRYKNTVIMELDTAVFLTAHEFSQDTELLNLYLASDFMVDPNLFSYKIDNVYLAFNSGCLPIISFNGIGVEYLKDGKNGFLIAKNDLKSFKKTINRALNFYTSPDFSDLPKSLMPNITWKIVAEKHTELYEKTCQINQHNKNIQ